MFKLGELIGIILKLIWRICVGVFKFIFNGIINSSKRYRILIFVYILLAILTITICYTTAGNYAKAFVNIIHEEPNYDAVFAPLKIIFAVDVLVVVFFGFLEYVKSYNELRRKKLFSEIFQEIQLYTHDQIIPEYLYEQEISPFLTCLVFKTLTPLQIWYQKKEMLEMYANIKITDIYQAPDNMRIVNVLVQRAGLPEHVQWDNQYINQAENVLNVGLSVYGIAGINLEMYPHAFVAGETGSGKSNILKCMIYQSIVKGYKVVLIDFKRGVSFSAFNGVVDVYYEYDTVIEVLNNMVEETKQRLDLFRQNRVDNINDYNRATGNNLKRIVIYIDELAELLKTRDKEISHKLNDSLESLTRLARATGIHLIMGIQRPDSDTVNGQIKNNTPFRVCGRFTDREPSRIMLASDAASNLPNVKGRFLIKADSVFEVQAFYFWDGIANTAFLYKDYNTETLSQKEEQPGIGEKQESINSFEFNFNEKE